MQNNAALLRKVLGDESGEVLEGVGEGYRVRVGQEALDSLRFEGAVKRARGLEGAGDVGEALAELERGLGLWRGRALAGLSGRVIEAGAARLDEARLGAIEERVELRLRLGRAEAVVGELRELVAEQPLRERLAGQLMVALYRCGHGGEALEVYERVRQRLVEELGVDPGQRLRDLHAAVLREDPALEVDGQAADQFGAGGSGDATTGSGGAAMPMPAQLPADTAAFTGREEQLAKLDELLEAGEGTAVLSTVAGIGGVGKTALAVHWGHQRRDRFPDGQLYVNLRGFDRSEPVEPRQAVSGFLRALGQTGNAIPDTLDEAAALYRSLLADKQMLVVLDNARNVAQARPLLPASPSSFALVTSRDRLSGLTALDGAQPVRLDTLNQADSLELLANLLGAERLHAEPEAARRLAEMCGHLPLALRIAAANLATRPYIGIDGYLAELETSDRLELLAVDGDPDAAVAATFDHSYRTLDPETQDLFLRLGLFPGQDISTELAAVIAGQARVIVNRLLNHLENAHLLEQHQPGRYRYHDLVKDYAKQQADLRLNNSDHQTVRNHVIGWYFENRNSPPSSEYDNVVSALQAWQHHESAWRLLPILTVLANYGHDVAEIRRYVETGLQTAQRDKNTQGIYHLTIGIAMVHRHGGNLLSAIEYGRMAVEMAPPHISAAQSNLGSYLWASGKNVEAEALLLEAAS
ncbi:MAG: BTAD domain-containing putative transcriptional regulator, partial [Stackebrandtia sp.]